MFIAKEKKEEQKDALHREYGVTRNCFYIIKAYLRYKKSMIAYLIIGGIAGASMSYIWTIIAKLVIDMIERQAASPEKDIMPLVYLVIMTSAAELVFLWLNTLALKKLELGYYYTRFKIIGERIAKTLSMNSDTLETPDMLDRLQ